LSRQFSLTLHFVIPVFDDLQVTKAGIQFHFALLLFFMYHSPKQVSIMAKILIVYHSQTGNTRKMAQAVAEGAKSIEGVEVIYKKASEATVEDLLSADGLAIGTPENFGYMCGMVKDFFDRTYGEAQEKVFRKPFVVFISAGNDGTGALRAIERIALGYKFKTVYQPVIARGKITQEILNQCNELGATIAGGCQMNIY
jgi:multimeric flavodoxin WrbA